MNRHDTTNIFWALIFGTALLWLVLATCEAQASARSRQAELTARVAAASCIGEAGYHEVDDHMPRLDECAAILHVFDYAYENRWVPRAGTEGHRVMRRGIRAFSMAVKPRRSHPRPWLLRLADDGRTGIHSVDRAMPSFLELTRRWVDGEELVDPCPGAIDFGGEMDHVRPGWEVIACEGGASRNDFRRRRESGGEG